MTNKGMVTDMTGSLMEDIVKSALEFLFISREAYLLGLESFGLGTCTTFAILVKAFALLVNGIYHHCPRSR